MHAAANWVDGLLRTQNGSRGLVVCQQSELMTVQVVVKFRNPEYQ